MPRHQLTTFSLYSLSFSHKSYRGIPRFHAGYLDETGHVKDWYMEPLESFDPRLPFLERHQLATTSV
jgi:hypothetical protein